MLEFYNISWNFSLVLCALLHTEESQISWLCSPPWLWSRLSLSFVPVYSVLTQLYSIHTHVFLVCGCILEGSPGGQFQEFRVDPDPSEPKWTPCSYLPLESEQSLRFQLWFPNCHSFLFFGGSPVLRSFCHPVASFNVLLDRPGYHAGVGYSHLYFGV